MFRCYMRSGGKMGKQILQMSNLKDFQ